MFVSLPFQKRSFNRKSEKTTCPALYAGSGWCIPRCGISVIKKLHPMTKHRRSCAPGILPSSGDKHTKESWLSEEAEIYGIVYHSMKSSQVDLTGRGNIFCTTYLGRAPPDRKLGSTCPLPPISGIALYSIKRISMNLSGWWNSFCTTYWG